MRWPSPNGCRTIPRSPGCPIPACPATRTTRCAKKYSPLGAGAVFTFGLNGGYRRRHQAGRGGRAVLASRQCRRHQIADHPPGLDHPPATCRTSRRSRPAPARTWCAFRSASRTSRTSSPIWSRRSPRSEATMHGVQTFSYDRHRAHRRRKPARRAGPRDFGRSEIPHLECRGGRGRALRRHLGGDAPANGASNMTNGSSATSCPGVSVITEDGGEARTVRAGDSFRAQAGLQGKLGSA